jgi:hypothetical protein
MADGSREVHPIRRPEVQEEIERFTREQLRLSGGTGRISIEFDFKGGRAVCWRPVAEGARRDLTQSD